MIDARRWVAALLVVLLLFESTPAAAGASRPAVASGVAPRHDTVELTAELARIADASRGRVRLGRIGESTERRPIWLATVGWGPVRLLYVTEQHGDEPLTTESALLMLRHFGLRNDPATEATRSRVTIGIVVRANPDGHERGLRYNGAAGADPLGFDPNRYHDPTVGPESNPVPEAAAVQRAFTRLAPHIVLDFHDRPAGSGHASVLWATAPEVASSVVTASRRVSVAVRDALGLAGGVVTRYPGGVERGIARNGYAMLGAATSMVALATPRRAADESYQVFYGYLAMISVARVAANGSLWGIDPGAADQIPPTANLGDDGFDAG